jgi:hypothetical protein
MWFIIYHIYPYLVPMTVISLLFINMSPTNNYVKIYEPFQDQIIFTNIKTLLKSLSIMSHHLSIPGKMMCKDFKILCGRSSNLFNKQKMLNTKQQTMVL